MWVTCVHIVGKIGYWNIGGPRGAVEIFHIDFFVYQICSVIITPGHDWKIVVGTIYSMTAAGVVYGSVFIRNFNPVIPYVGGCVIMGITNIISNVFKSPNIISSVEIAVWRYCDSTEVIVTTSYFPTLVNKNGS